MIYPFGINIPSAVTAQGDYRKTLWTFYKNHHKHFAEAENCGQLYVAKALVNGSYRLVSLNPDGGPSLACYVNKRTVQMIPFTAGDLLVGTVAFQGESFLSIDIVANFGQVI